jgi:hypothetical protein
MLFATLEPLFAQARTRGSSGGEAAAGSFAIVFMILYLLLIAAFVIPTVAGMWKVFEKAGQPGWAAIVPIYNLVVLFQIAGKPVWWIVFLFIPCVNIVGFVFVIIAEMELAKRFGKDPVYGLGLAFLGFIFWPMLGFGSARYRGPRAARFDDEDDYDRPRARRRPADYDEEEEKERPRRPRRRDEDDDYEDRPRPRRRDDY